MPTVVAGSYGPACVDAADVTLTGSPAGGTWSGIGVTGNKFDPSVGTQELTYTYTNANGCTNFDKTTITVNPLPTVIAGSYGPVCVDAADVTLTGSPAGGTWSGIGVTGNKFDPSVGTQELTYTYTNANGCTNFDKTTITVNPLPTVVVNSPIACSDASATVIATPGTAGIYNYFWTVPSGAPSPGNTASFTTNIAGNYSVIITNLTTTCSSSSASGLVTINSVISLSAAPIAVSCKGSSDGSVDLTVTGGTAPYTYSWSNGASTEDLSLLAAGVYTVTVTDAYGCSKETSATVNESEVLLSLSAAPIAVSCKGSSDGSVDLTVTGGTAPYTYSWSNGASTEDLSLLAAGVYTVTVTDAYGCSKETSATVNESEVLLSLSAAPIAVSCKGSSDGSVDLTVTGGTAPYTYSWSNGASTEDLSLLAAGVYTVTVTDAYGCSKETSATVNESEVLLSLSAAPIAVSCKGSSDGSVDLTVTGGTAPYTYSWSNGASTEDLSLLAAGVYTVTVTDAYGCSKETSATVNESEVLLSLSAAPIAVSCKGSSDGSVDLTVTGGTAPYTYSWSNGASTEDLSLLAAGVYTVTVTDAYGCSKETSATVNESEVLLSLSAAPIAVSCKGSSDGSVDLTVTGGTAPYTYSWSNGASTEDLSLLAAGVYTVTVTDAYGCSKETSATVNESEVLLSLSAAPIAVSCKGSSDGSVDLTVTGGTAPYTYSWSNGASTEDLSLLAAGVYTVTVTDAYGCSKETSATVNESEVLLSLSAAPIAVSCKGSSDGSVDLTVTGGTAPYTYSWSNGASTEDLSLLAAGVYTITVTDAYGCKKEATATVNESSPPSLSINDVEVNESVGKATLTVTLSTARACDVSFTVNTANNTALAPGDYTTVSSTIYTIPGGSTTVTVYVPIADDKIAEPTEAFFVQLSNPINSIIADDQGIVTINDDDSPPNVIIGDASATEGNILNFPVSLSNVSSADISVTLGFTHITTSNGDFVMTPVTVLFPAGTDSVTAQVQSISDNIQELNETFVVKVTGTSGPVGNTSDTGTGTIVDDDQKPIAIDDSLTTDEDVVLNGDVSVNDFPNGTNNIWSLLTQPSHGKVTMNTNGTFVYTPNTDYNGNDSFTYKLCDTDGDCDDATVFIAMKPVDDFPVANDDTF